MRKSILTIAIVCFALVAASVEAAGPTYFLSMSSSARAVDDGGIDNLTGTVTLGSEVPTSERDFLRLAYRQMRFGDVVADDKSLELAYGRTFNLGVWQLSLNLLSGITFELNQEDNNKNPLFGFELERGIPIAKSTIFGLSLFTYITTTNEGDVLTSGLSLKVTPPVGP